MLKLRNPVTPFLGPNTEFVSLGHAFLVFNLNSIIRQLKILLALYCYQIHVLDLDGVHQDRCCFGNREYQKTRDVKHHSFNRNILAKA